MPAISNNVIRDLFATGDRARTARRKGDCLEGIARIIFEAIPGIELADRHVLNSPGSMEIDLVFLNNLDRDGFVDFERFILVECKNWDAAVDAATVRDFRVKLERKKRKYGFLIATNGITGDPVRNNAAHDEIRMALVELGIYIIVVDRADIQALRTGADFVRLTLLKMAKIIVSA